MRLRHALLVLLAERDHTGYDITRRMRETIGQFWSAPHSQIYPELAAMATDGLVTMTESDGPGPRTKKSYEITAAGRSELRQWLGSDYRPRRPRNERVLRAFAAASADSTELARVFRDEAERITTRLTELDESRAEVDADPHTADPSEPSFGWSLALLEGVLVLEARRDWCNEVATRLERSRFEGS